MRFTSAHNSAFVASRPNFAASLFAIVLGFLFVNVTLICIVLSFLFEVMLVNSFPFCIIKAKATALQFRASVFVINLY